MIDYKIYQIALITIVFSLTSHISRAEFLISTSHSCLLLDSYYEFLFVDGLGMLDADIDVAVLGYASMSSDLSMRLVNSAQEADLLLVDDHIYGIDTFHEVDMHVCKGYFLSNDAMKIYVSNTSFNNDIVVSVDEDIINQDYKIFIDSDVFTVKEAVALFASIWALNRRK